MSNPPKKVIDTRSGRVFPALNQCYLFLLREGELEEMRRAGKLKDNPEEDTFGYYRMRKNNMLLRTLPPGLSHISFQN